MKLFCFPYAGGSSLIYKDWNKELGDLIQTVPMELAGRGSRSDQPLSACPQEAIDDLLSSLNSQLDDDVPYLLFGHSMGALIAFELAKRANRPPLHLFISGHDAPEISPPKVRDLSDEMLIQELRELGGTAPFFFECPELIDYFLPILRSDFQLIDSLKYHSSVLRLSVSMTVLYGSTDYYTNVNGWKNFSNGTCDFQEIQGGHFYVQENKQSVHKVIRRTIDGLYSCFPPVATNRKEGIV